MPPEYFLTHEERIEEFLKTVNKSFGLKEISFVNLVDSEGNATCDFAFKIKSDAFNADVLTLDPCRELISVMRDAAKKYFQSPLHVDETKSIFSVIP